MGSVASRDADQRAIHVPGAWHMVGADHPVQGGLLPCSETRSVWFWMK